MGHPRSMLVIFVHFNPFNCLFTPESSAFLKNHQSYCDPNMKEWKQTERCDFNTSRQRDPSLQHNWSINLI